MKKKPKNGIQTTQILTVSNILVKYVDYHKQTHGGITFSNATIKFSLAVVNGLSTARLRKYR
jgi:hypothetical protein